MQTIQQISTDQLAALVATVYAQSSAIVKETYSAVDSNARSFATPQELMDDLTGSFERGESFRQYSIYYPECGGMVHEKRIALIPRKCQGHTYRFSQEGWGLISLQCRRRALNFIECRICVNTEARARSWHSTCPHFGSPDVWNWPIVMQLTGRLVRQLRAAGKNTAQFAQTDTEADRTRPSG